MSLDTSTPISEIVIDGVSIPLIGSDYEQVETTVKSTGEEQVILPEAGQLFSKITVEAVEVPPFEPKFMQLNNGTLTEVLEEDLKGATALRGRAFSGQSHLSKAHLPDTITSIGDYAFYNCTNLVDVKLSNNITSLPSNCFDTCRTLQTLVIPEGVTSLSYGTFFRCNALTNLYVPTTLKTLNSNPWENDAKSKNIYIKDLSAFCSLDSTTTQYAGIGFSLKEGLSKLFLNEEHITNLVIPDEIVTIARVCFRCFDFVTADLKNVYTIRNNAFWECKVLESVVIGENIGSIENQAFATCSKLTSMTINKVCSSVSDVPTLANVNAIPTSCIIYVPDADTRDFYKQKTNWSSYTIEVKS